MTGENNIGFCVVNLHLPPHQLPIILNLESGMQRSKGKAHTGHRGGALLLPRSEGDEAVLLAPMAGCLFLAATAPVSLPIFEPHLPTTLVII